MANYPIEGDTRLSESSIWGIQQNYFNHKGVAAWNDEVPFFISSNAFISTRYAHLVVQYVLDAIKDPQQPLYIVEVGAGPGKFSFYFLRAFEKALKKQKIDLNYQFILTDVAQKNVEFCKNNEALKPLIEDGRLDFAIFDADKDEDFSLIQQGIPFSQKVKGGQAIFICNYVFDVITQDLFQFDQETLSEVRIALSSRYDKFDIEKPNNLKEVDIDYKAYPIESDSYYPNSNLNKLLFDYKKHFSQDEPGMFMFPLGAMHFYDRMAKICDKFLIVCGDIGHVTLDELSRVNVNNCHTYEGCFCFMHNFHALGEYIRACGGDYCLTEHRNAFKISLYTHGQSIEQLPKTVNYFQGEMEQIGADEFCYMNDEFAYNNYRYSMKACLSFLRMSCYEPDTYFHMHDKLIDTLPSLPESLSEDINHALKEVEHNLYHYQSFYDVFSLLGMFHLKVKQFDEAEALFKQALKYGKKPFVPLRSLALMYDERGNSNLAIKYYKKALTYNKKDYLCKTRISILEGSPALVVKPVLKAIAVFAGTLALLYLLLMK